MVARAEAGYRLDHIDIEYILPTGEHADSFAREKMPELEQLVSALRKVCGDVQVRETTTLPAFPIFAVCDANCNQYWPRWNSLKKANITIKM